jgi:hypothetical protein
MDVKVYLGEAREAKPDFRLGLFVGVAAMLDGKNLNGTWALRKEEHAKISDSQTEFASRRA